jgi:hypothetical protein
MCREVFAKIEKDYCLLKRSSLPTSVYITKNVTLEQLKPCNLSRLVEKLKEFG